MTSPLGRLAHLLPKNRRALRRARSLIGLLLLLTTLGLVIHHLDAGHVPRERLFHSEAVYPAALYLDLAHWDDWNVPFAPYFLPDIALFFPAMAIFDDPTTAVYAVAAGQFLLLVAGAWFLFGKLVSGEKRDAARRWTVLAGATLALAIANGLHGRGILLQLFTAAFHTGAFILAVYGQILLLRLRHKKPSDKEPGRKEPHTLDLLLLFLLCWLGTFSDPLLVVLFVAPVCGLWIFDRKAQSLRIPLAAGAGGVLGLASIPWLNRTNTLRVAEVEPIDRSQAFETLLTLPEREGVVFSYVIDRFFEGLTMPYRLAWFTWVGLTLYLALRPFWQRFFWKETAEHASQDSLTFFARLNLMSFAVTTAATCFFAVGRYGADSATYGILFINRYLIGLYTLPLLAAGFYWTIFLKQATLRRLEIAWIAMLILGIGFQLPRIELRGFPVWKPPEVACLDEQIRARGWRHGLAFFSKARHIQVFTETEVEMDQITWDLRPISWIGRRTRRGEASGYDFLVADGLRAPMVEALGEPREKIDCGGLILRVYDHRFYDSEETPRAVINTPTSKKSPPTGTSSTPSPGSPP